MTTQKKIIAIVLSIAGALVLVCNLLGILGAWVAASAINSFAVTTLTVVENTAQRSSQLLGEANNSLGQLQTSVTTLTTQVNQVGTNISENPVIFNALKQEFDERATPAMRQVVQTTRGAHAALNQAAATAEALNANPLTARMTPDFTRLQALDAAVDEILGELMAVGAMIGDLKTDSTQAVTGAITTRLTRVDNALKTAMEAVTTLTQRVNALEAQAVALQSTIPFWVNVTAFIATILMLAAVVAGAALAWMGISYLRSNGQAVETFMGKFALPSGSAKQKAK